MSARAVSLGVFVPSAASNRSVSSSSRHVTHGNDREITEGTNVSRYPYDSISLASSIKLKNAASLALDRSNEMEADFRIFRSSNSSHGDSRADMGIKNKSLSIFQSYYTDIDSISVDTSSKLLSLDSSSYFSNELRVNQAASGWTIKQQDDSDIGSIDTIIVSVVSDEQNRSHTYSRLYLTGESKKGSSLDFENSDDSLHKSSSSSSQEMNQKSFQLSTDEENTLYVTANERSISRSRNSEKKALSLLIDLSNKANNAGKFSEESKNEQEEFLLSSIHVNALIKLQSMARMIPVRNAYIAAKRNIITHSDKSIIIIQKAW
eukprot:CAMPEP_0194331094 /NCGR_PEP_ID=MMETSP0171-20130528/54332_1 /TAXON_ID=218684 /ORGANISM="Corethron pennatum, Strain L29A3" /LENGTH=319 /DNA_ID=CAMNT_0039092433 /DNA_START=168 /DNA_END=1124 /DNA_ORIENTATION=+